MKKLIAKLIGSLLMLTVAVAAASVLSYLIWGYCVPQGYAAGAVAQKEVQEYLVAQMPELEGADASQVSFDADGIYHVYYDGKTFIANDATVQNNIGAFVGKYGGFDFRSKIATRSMSVTILAIAFWFFSIAISVTNTIDCSRKIREEKAKKATQALNAAT